MRERSPLLPIFLIVLVDVLGLGIASPLLPLYAESLHGTPFQATLLVTTYAVCQIVSGPLLGRISDRTGRRPMLLVSQAGTFLAFLVMARASALWMLFAARAIDGSTAGNLSLAQAYIADNTEPKDRAKSFALIGIAFGVGFLVGPLLTLYLSRYGLGAPMYAAATLSFTSIACTFFLLPRKEAVAAEAPRRIAVLDWAAYADHFRRPVLGGLLVQFLLYMLTFWTFTAGFPLFAERTFQWDGHPFTVREIGAVYAFVALLGILLQGGLVGRMVTRFGEGRLIVWGFLSLVAGYAFLGQIHQIAWLITAATVLSFGNGVLRPTLTSLVTLTADRREQGVVLGLTQSLSSVAMIAAPPLAGFLIGRGQLNLWAWVAAGAALIGLVSVRWGSAKARSGADGVRAA